MLSSGGPASEGRGERLGCGVVAEHQQERLGLGSCVLTEPGFDAPERAASCDWRSTRTDRQSRIPRRAPQLQVGEEVGLAIGLRAMGGRWPLDLTFAAMGYEEGAQRVRKALKVSPLAALQGPSIGTERSPGGELADILNDDRIDVEGLAHPRMCHVEARLWSEQGFPPRARLKWIHSGEAIRRSTIRRSRV